tara:strand:+ start:315 stop:2018 length:1704 start_codon:yes stop_codon:yes gene_type:complete
MSNKYTIKDVIDHRSAPIKQLVSRFVRDIPDKHEYLDRLEEELDIIEKKDFIKCFNQVSDIIDYTRSQGIPHVLRGSGASSLMCYLLGITNIDPVEENMALSRFMNHNREDQPDIDIDVPHWVRPQILDYLYQKWPGRVARISNDVKYREKTALRKVLKEHGVKGRIPKHFKVADYFSNEDKITQIYTEASALVGTHRHWSLHCGGLIVYDDKVPEDLILKDNQINLTKYDVDEQNLIKIDLLCNRGLSQLWEIDKRLLNDYPAEDANVSRLLCKGDVLGLTQAESRTMRKCLVALQPKNWKDVALALALIRPAAADGGRKAAYFRDLADGKKKNMMIYDDDSIYFIAESLGITMDKADGFRRAFKKRDEYKISEFFRLLNKRRWKELKVRQLNDLNKYSFCKGHALAYGQLVWALAYHKCYNPNKFWKATLKHCNSSYKKWVHKREAQLNGVFLKNKNYKLDIKDQFLKNGWWSGKEFMPGCTLEEVQKGYYMFRGLVANTRTIRRYGRGLKFVTIGYDNGKYIDLVIKNDVWQGNYTIVQGCGKMCKKDGSEYIEVEKMWKTWFE